MAFFRQYIAPLLIVLVFLFALVVVSARIFLPSDMAAPAPLSELTLPEPTVVGQFPSQPQRSQSPSVSPDQPTATV